VIRGLVAMSEPACAAIIANGAHEDDSAFD
jgi:hypothetical protein